MAISHMFFLTLVSALAVVIIGGATQYFLWPPTLNRCSINDPERDKCLLKMTENAIPKVSKGLSLIGLNSLDPLRDAKFSVSNDRWPVPLTLETDQVSIMGPSNMHVRSASFEDQTSTLVIQGFHDTIRLIGNYRVRGSILLFPVNSAGTFDIEMRGALANHTLQLATNVRDVSHGQVGFKLFSLNNVRVALRDPSLGVAANRAINRLVNDNWKIISRALTPSMERVIHDIYSEALQPLTSKFTVDDFFPYYNIENDEDDEDYEEEDANETVGQPVIAYSYYHRWK